MNLLTCWAFQTSSNLRLPDVSEVAVTCSNLRFLAFIDFAMSTAPAISSSHNHSNILYQCLIQQSWMALGLRCIKQGYRFIAEIFLKICGPFWCKICGINMRNLAKYALKYAHMRHYGNMRRKWRVWVCLRWTKCAEMSKNAIAYAEICEFLHNLCINKYSKCINKYSKFEKCHYMR